jgi:hypothetical protein
MKVHDLVESVKGLYGELRPSAILHAQESGILSAEEASLLAGEARQENYRKHLAGCRQRAEAHDIARYNAKCRARDAALQQDVGPGMVLRGTKWVKIAV